MNATLEKILFSIAFLAIGFLVGRFLWPHEVSRETIRWETKIDSALVRVQALRIDSLQGRIYGAEAVVSQERRESASWKARAAQLKRLADSMAGSSPTLPTLIAELDTVVESEGRFRDSVGVKYDIGLDLWRDLRLSLAERPVVFRDSIKIVEREIAVEKTAWTLTGIGAAAALVLGVLIAK